MVEIVNEVSREHAHGRALQHTGSEYTSTEVSEVSVRQVSEKFPTVPTVPTHVGSVGTVGSDTPTLVGPTLPDTCMRRVFQ